MVLFILLFWCFHNFFYLYTRLYWAVICLECLCLLCCCCQYVYNHPLGCVLRLTAGVRLQLHSRHNAGLWHNWHRHSTPCHSIRRLPLAPGLELPPPGAFSSRRLSTHRRIGERWSDFGWRKDQHKYIQHVKYSWSKTTTFPCLSNYRRKRQLQTV